MSDELFFECFFFGLVGLQVGFWVGRFVGFREGCGGSTVKLFSAMLDLALVPVSVVKDVVDPWPMFINGKKSATRKTIEAVERDLGL